MNFNWSTFSYLHSFYPDYLFASLLSHNDITFNGGAVTGKKDKESKAISPGKA